MNFRAGRTYRDIDVSVFARNLTDSHQAQGNAGNGVAGCQITGGTGCTVFNNFNPFVAQAYQRPREVGVQANYRF